MELLPYSEFSALRMQDFWPQGFRATVDTGTECCMGFGDGERTRFCHFLWPPSMPGVLGEIRLEAFGPSDCPEEVAEGLLRRLNLPLRPRMSKADVEAVLGVPGAGSNRVSDIEYLHFDVGDQWPYHLLCTCSTNGLIGIIIVRGDFYVKAER